MLIVSKCLTIFTVWHMILLYFYGTSFKMPLMNVNDWTCVYFVRVSSWSTDQGSHAGVRQNLRAAVRGGSLQQRPLWDRGRKGTAVTAAAPKGKFDCSSFEPALLRQSSAEQLTPDIDASYPFIFTPGFYWQIVLIQKFEWTNKMCVRLSSKRCVPFS